MIYQLPCLTQKQNANKINSLLADIINQTVIRQQTHPLSILINHPDINIEQSKLSEQQIKQKANQQYMSYHLDQLSYLRRTSLNNNRSQYNLMKDMLIVDGREGRWGRRESQDTRGYVDPVVSSVRRDQMLLMSKQSLTGNKSLLIKPQHQSKSHLSTQLSQSSLIYPYTYTEYSMMKQKEQNKRRIDEEWLQNEVKRIREENERYNKQKRLLTKADTNNQADKSSYYGSCKHITHNQQVRNTFLYDDLKQEQSDYEEIEDDDDGQNQKQCYKKNKSGKVDDIEQSKSHSGAYSRLLVFNSSSNQQPTGGQHNNKSSSPNMSQTIFFNGQNNNQHKPSNRVQQYKHQQSQYPQMNRPLQHGYPIFSPLKVHKHLPHNQNQHALYHDDDQKRVKHLRALEQRKQNEFFQTSAYGQHGMKQFPILQQLQRKKLLTKSYDHHTFVERKAFYQHKRNEEVEQLVRNPEVGKVGIVHQHQHHLQNTQAMVNGLKVELEILKQQLDDKNRKFVDMEIELLELKCGIFSKTHQKTVSQLLHNAKQASVSTQTDFEDREMHDYGANASQQQVKTESLDASTQTMPLQRRTLHLSQITMSLHLQTIKTTHNSAKALQTQLEKQRELRKKMQQKLCVHQQAMNNFLQDIEMYQNQNKQLHQKIETLQSEKHSSPNNKQ